MVSTSQVHTGDESTFCRHQSLVQGCWFRRLEDVVDLSRAAAAGSAGWRSMVNSPRNPCSNSELDPNNCSASGSAFPGLGGRICRRNARSGPEFLRKRVSQHGVGRKVDPGVCADMLEIRALPRHPAVASGSGLVQEARFAPLSGRHIWLPHGRANALPRAKSSPLLSALRRESLAPREASNINDDTRV